MEHIDQPISTDENDQTPSAELKSEVNKELIMNPRSPLAKLTFRLIRKVRQASVDFGLIEDGDRIAVAVSGGKDSLTLLRLLDYSRDGIPIQYEFVAVHIISDHRCAGCTHAKVLEGIFEKNHYKYHFEPIKVLDENNRVSCFWCSWNRRKALFKVAEQLGCNKVAFGHHKDDMVQTTLLNLFYHGELSTMEPRVDLFEGRLSIIRPLTYIEEKEIITYARHSQFPHQFCACPNSKTSKRRFVREMLAQLEKDNKQIKNNLFICGLKGRVVRQHEW